ncbi:MAG: DUF1269 domain-containing protein [Burkholderiaceae bacterium]
MRRRIYRLMPDLASARGTMRDLLLARIEARHIHFVGQEGMDISGLHAANIWQTSDVVHAAQTGLVLGAVTGMVAGLLAAVFYPIAADVPQWEVLAALAILGGMFGAWSSSMIGISIPSTRLQRFEAVIEQGQILLMVDVPRSRVGEIEALLQSSPGQVGVERADSDVPAFP